ncbi:MAG: hypothetical protein KTQ14_04460 [Fusobacteriaceae bacterium]|nr:hypothetical protein [Fusobacteriaceae bacterium]
MSIDRALSKKVQYEVKETYLSDFDFSEFSISEDDKEKLLEKEELIRNSQQTIGKNLYDIAKNLYESQQILSKYGTGSFVEWFKNLGIDKNYVYRMIAKYNLYQETKEKKAIDLSVRLIEEMKKEDLDIEEKIEIVKSEKPNKKFKEIKYGFSHSEKNEKLELDNLKIKLQKSREMLKKYQLQISKLEEKIAAIINKS